jgi:TetR/AcrR family tetracycline transcriptional repressor
MYMPASAATLLTREAIVDAAIELVAEQGYDRLTIRALAERLEVATMTMYRHVRDKEDLLGAMAERHVGQIELADAGEDWAGEIAAIARSVYRMLLAHPQLAETVARQHIAGPGAYRGAEAVLGALRRGNIEGDRAVAAFAALVAFVCGFALQRIHGSTPTELGQRFAVLEGLPHDDFPEVKGLGAAFIRRDTDAHFELGLEMFLRGLASR